MILNLEGTVMQIISEERTGKNGSVYWYGEVVISTGKSVGRNVEGFKATCLGEGMCEVLSHNAKVGDNVEVDVQLELSEYNGKWYNSMTLTNIKKVMGPGDSFEESDFSPNTLEKEAEEKNNQLKKEEKPKENSNDEYLPF